MDRLRGCKCLVEATHLGESLRAKVVGLHTSRVEHHDPVQRFEHFVVMSGMLKQACEAKPDTGVARPFMRQFTSQFDRIVRDIEALGPELHGVPGPFVTGLVSQRELRTIEGVLRLAGFPEPLGEKPVGHRIERGTRRVATQHRDAVVGLVGIFKRFGKFAGGGRPSRCHGHGLPQRIEPPLGVAHRVAHLSAVEPQLGEQWEPVRRLTSQFERFFEPIQTRHLLNGHRPGVPQIWAQVEKLLERFEQVDVLVGLRENLMGMGDERDQPFAGVRLTPQFRFEEFEGVALLLAATTRLKEFCNEKFLVDVRAEPAAQDFERLFRPVGPTMHLRCDAVVPGVVGFEFVGPLNRRECLHMLFAVGEEQGALPPGPGILGALVEHLLNHAVGIGFRIAGEKLRLQLQERVVVRESLAGLSEVRPGGGAAIGFIQQRNRAAMPFRRGRVELQQFERVNRSRTEIGRDPRDPRRRFVPDLGRRQRLRGSKVDTRVVRATEARVALGAEQIQVAERRRTGRQARSVHQLVDRLIECGECLLGLVAIHQCVVQGSRRGRDRSRGTARSLLKETHGLRHLIRRTRRAKVRICELILAFLQGAGEAIDFGRIFESPRFPPLRAEEEEPGGGRGSNPDGPP